MAQAFLILGLFVLALLLATLNGSFFTVHTAQAAIIQRFGRFLRVATPGLNFKLPFFDHIAARMNMRVQQLDVVIESKTKDDVVPQRSARHSAGLGLRGPEPARA